MTMSFRDIFNPWRALREERARIVALEDHIAFQQRQIRENLDASQRFAATAAKRSGLIAEQQKRIGELNRILATGHFRDPETGRLGPRGKVYL